MTNEELEKLHFNNAVLKTDMTILAQEYTNRDLLTTILSKLTGEPIEAIEYRAQQAFLHHYAAIEKSVSEQAPGTTKMQFFNS